MDETGVLIGVLTSGQHPGNRRATRGQDRQTLPKELRSRLRRLTEEWRRCHGALRNASPVLENREFPGYERATMTARGTPTGVIGNTDVLPRGAAVSVTYLLASAAHQIDVFKEGTSIQPRSDQEPGHHYGPPVLIERNHVSLPALR